MCMGDSIVRKTDARLSKDEDIVVCFTGSKNRERGTKSNENRGT